MNMLGNHNLTSCSIFPSLFTKLGEFSKAGVK